MKRIIACAFILLTVALISPRGDRMARANSGSLETNSASAPTIATVGLPSAQSIVVLPEPFVVAPGQPAPEPRSTVGLINALCDVTLNIVGCGFMPTEITLACDANTDGVAELVLPLKDITLVNRLLIQARLPVLAPHLAGTPFPLSCCGGVATLTLTRRVGAGDDNIFGPFTQSISVPIDLGIRAPVVLSASPSGGDCSVGQNILIPGSCFVVEGNKPNVTSVFAVDRDNPNNVIQSNHFAIMNSNLIDAFFEFGAANAGRTFLIFASGPNGTSRNLTALPGGAPAVCPLGNETGIIVTFTCEGASPPTTGGTPPPPTIPVLNCNLERNPSSGAFTLVLSIGGLGAPPDTTILVGGVAPKKIRFRDQISTDPPRFRTIILKKRFCRGLPGTITGSGSGGLIPVSPIFCGEICSN